ncbi:MAG: tRNA (adenosine(37)-N6)-dimethylallyltransferase MiaA, partial [Bacteroidetes bacterium]|nr:tRNA (adenosine(37)-N6)-dimethylallyltransferase MiaA [Bacteroidota bacterium]
IREELNIRLENEGIQSLQNQLEKLDSDSFNSISTDNPRRLIRALEVCLSSGKPYSYFKNQPKEKRLFETEYAGIDWPRETLYKRINERCEQMLTNGLLKEVESLYDFKHLNACQTVGYQEFFEYFDGNCSLDQAIEKFKQHTRNYAKRQITWFKKLDGVKWLQPSELE